MRLWTQRYQVHLERACYRLGLSIGYNPWKYIIGLFVITAISCLGFLRFHQMVEWCDFHPASEDKGKLVRNQDDWSVKEVACYMKDLDDALYKQKNDTIMNAAKHLFSQEHSYPRFPLVLIEGLVVNSDFWFKGICIAMNSFTAIEPVLVCPSPGLKWRELVAEIREMDEDAFVIVKLDSYQINAEYISNLFHILKFFKKKVSVVIPVIGAQLFGEMCSLRTLNQFDTMILKMGTPNDLLPVIMSHLTSENKNVLQFSPFILNFVRSHFLFVDGSIETVKDIIRCSILSHLLSPNCNKEWTDQARTEFSHLVSCYWKIAERLASEIHVSVADLHESVQSDLKLDDGFHNPFLDKIGSWFAAITARKVAEIAKYMMNICASNDKLAVRLMNMPIIFSKLVQYCERTKRHVVSDVTTTEKLRELSQTICFLFFQSFIAFPYGKQFVVTSREVAHQYADYQLQMERSLLREDNECAICYRALRESDKWKRISINEWAAAFFIKIKGKDDRLNRAAFFASVYLLEKCGIVGATHKTPKGYVDIYYHPLLTVSDVVMDKFLEETTLDVLRTEVPKQPNTLFVCWNETIDHDLLRFAFTHGNDVIVILKKWDSNELHRLWFPLYCETVFIARPDHMVLLCISKSDPQLPVVSVALRSKLCETLGEFEKEIEQFTRNRGKEEIVHLVDPGWNDVVAEETVGRVYHTY